MKVLILSLLFLISTASFADVDVLCKKSSKASCDVRVYEALRQLGCNVSSNLVQCESAEDFGRGKELCKVSNVDNCSEPHAELFGFTARATKCWSGEKVSLRRADRGLSLDWTMGMIRSYVSDICVK